MKNRKNNKGFTLVELMVAVVISTIVIGAIWQFMLISTKSYDNQKQITDLQQEVQQTMNHVENILIDANRAVEFVTSGNTSTLEIYSANKISKLIWNQENKTLTYTETPVSNGVADTTATESAVLANSVEAFSADMSKVESDQIIKVAMEFSHKGRTYNATRNITLRNVVVVNNDPTEVYKDDIQKEQEITIVITNPVGEEGLEPGDSHVFQAYVSGTNDQSIIWTILPADSDDTSIDISSGKLYVGVDENTTDVLQEDKITVVATLASNRDIFTTTYVSVGPKPAVSISVDHFPSAVIYGKNYNLQATATPATGTTLKWSVVSGGATITGTGTSQRLSVASNPTAPTELIQVKVEALVEGRVVREQILETKVRQPEFTIAAIDYNSKTNPAKFDRGSQVTLTADWSGSYANRAGYIEYDEFYGTDRYVKYANGGFTNEKITWTAWYTKGGSTVNIPVTNGKFDMPLDLSVSRVTVKGVSQTYPFVSYQKVLDLATPTLTLKASIDGTAVTGMIPFKKTILVEPVLTGLDINDSQFDNWTVVGPNGSINKTVPSNKRSASFKLDTINGYMGKTIQVSVSEKTSGLTANLSLPIVNVLECEKSVTDSSNWANTSYKYLFSEKYKKSSSSFMYTYPSQNPFFIQLPGSSTANYKLEYTFFTKSGAVINDYSEVMTFTVKDKGILCEPVRETRRTEFDYNGFSHIIVHVDDISTGEHVAMYKLEPQMANYRDTDNGVSYYLPYTQETLDSLNKKDKSGTAEFINFYGTNVSGSEFNGANPSNYPQKTSYAYDYKYVSEKYSNYGQTKYRDTYTLTLKLNNVTVYTKKFTKSNNTWS